MLRYHAELFQLVAETLADPSFPTAGEALEAPIREHIVACLCGNGLEADRYGRFVGMLSNVIRGHALPDVLLRFNA